MEDNPIITTGIQAKFLKRWTAFRIPSKLLIIVALCECTAILVVAGFSLGRGAQASVCSTSTSPNSTNIIQKSDLPAYYLNQGIALIAWTVFFGVSVFDGTFSGNIYELYAAMLMALFVSAWSISRAIDTTFPNDFLDYLFLGTACFPQLFYIGVSPNLYKEYAWVLYRKAGADVAIRSLYIQYLIWSCLLKLDTVFGILSTFLSGRGVCNDSVSTVLDYSTLTVCLLFLGIGYYVVQREFIQYTRLWFLLFPILPTYNIAYLVLQYSTPLNPQTEHTWYTLRILYTVLAGLSLAAWLGLVYFTYIVYNNFGKKKKELKTPVL